MVTGDALDLHDKVGTVREGKGYPAGEKKSSQYVESFGQALVGHSRVGTSLVGDPDDSKRLSRILTLLWGSKPQSAYKKNCLRDSMHLSTAIRYGGTFFVTGEKAILNKAQLIEVEFGIKIRNPKDCLTEVEEMIRKYELYKKDI